MIPSLNASNPFDSQQNLIFGHFAHVAAWKLHGDAFPIQMEINLTNVCNEACNWCISANSHYSNPSMSSEDRDLRVLELDRQSAISNHPERRRGIETLYVQSFLSQAKEMGLKNVVWSGGGEPTTHPHFSDIVQNAHVIGVDQGLMTNGLYPSTYNKVIGDRLCWVRVSLDTLDEDRYRHQKRSGGFLSVLANIKELVPLSVKVGINMNIAAWNVDEIMSMAEWSREVGVDYFQIRPILGLPFQFKDNEPYRQQLGVDWVRDVRPTLEAAESLSTDCFRVVVSWDKFEDIEAVETDFGRTYTACKYHFFICVLNANGDLTVCMYHLGDDRFSFGNIYEQDLRSIWYGPKRQEVIKMCSNDLDFSTCQVCCKGHEINKLMHSIEVSPNGFL